MLDIGVGNELHRPSDPNEPSLGFDDDGYYWFLYPLFEKLADETGQFIDPYGYAMFAGSDLRALSRMLVEAREIIEAQPNSWRVPSASRPGVKRDEFLRLLSLWEGAVSRAQHLGRAVICFGD